MEILCNWLVERLRHSRRILRSPEEP